MGLFDWAAIGVAFWALSAFGASVVLEFKSGNQRIEWPNPDRVFDSSRYHGQLLFWYRVFVVWCLVGPIGAVVGFALVVGKAIMNRM